MTGKAQNKKLCIFCGLDVVKPSDEHVLGEWVIKETGNPKREWSYFVFNEKRPILKFSIDNFVFTACEKCNNDAALLEDRAKPVIKSLNERQPISAEQAEHLLDWLDKVRVGLWLGYMKLSGNSFGVDPRFHINSRIGMKDRMAIVYPYNSKPETGLSIYGHNTPISYFHPSCFGIKINKVFIISLSDDFLVAPWINLPFPKNRTVHESGAYSFDQMTSRLNPKLPTAVSSLYKPSLLIGQGIVSSNIYNQFQSDYWPSVMERRIKLVDSRAATSRIYNFLNSSYQPDDESIDFGAIALHEAAQFGTLTNQTFALQEWLFKYKKHATTPGMLEIEKLQKQFVRKLLFQP